MIDCVVCLELSLVNPNPAWDSDRFSDYVHRTYYVRGALPVTLDLSYYIH